MKRFYLVLLLIFFFNISHAQNEFRLLFYEYKSSIELPYYYESNVLSHNVAKGISGISISDGKMKIDYSMLGGRKKNSNGYYKFPEVRDVHQFTVEINMAKSKVKKGEENYDLRVWIEDDEGIRITNIIENESFRETFLMNWFGIKTNSAALRDKLFKALEKEFQPYMPAQQETIVKTVQSKKTNPTKPKKISNKYSE